MKNGRREKYLTVVSGKRNFVEAQSVYQAALERSVKDNLRPGSVVAVRGPKQILPPWYQYMVKFNPGILEEILD